MTIREQLTEKKSQLAGLKERIEANEVEAINEGEALVTEINELEEKCKASEKAQALINSIGSKKEDVTMEEKTTMQTITEKVQSVDRSVKGWSTSVEVKAATDVTTVGPNIHENRNNINTPTTSKIADLFINMPVSGNAITYFVRQATEGAPAVTAEGAKKPQVSIKFTPKTVALEKVAGYTKVTDEVLDDAPFLAAAVEKTMTYELDTAENKKVVTDIAATSGIGALTYAKGSGALGMLEAILAAQTQIADGDTYVADAVIMNPSDIQKLKLVKDSNGQYLLGGPSFGPYGNGNYKADLVAWGLPVRASSALTAGTFLVTSKPAVEVYRKEGLKFNIYDQNEDDAVCNRATMVAEERLVVAVVDPSAVIKVTEAAS